MPRLCSQGSYVVVFEVLCVFEGWVCMLQIMPPGASLKAKKGKKQETIRSDLAHILGYTGSDMEPVGPPSPVGSEKETAAAGIVHSKS